MKICVTGPIATDDLLPWLTISPAQAGILPTGYSGAPLTSVLVGQLLARGHQVLALTVDYSRPPGSVPVRLHGPNLEYIVLPGRRRAWRNDGRHIGRALDLFRLERRALARTIADARPDVVHAHWTYEFALGALESGQPTLVTAHDSPRKVLRHTRSPYRAIRWLMARSVAHRAQHLTAVSDYMAQEWQRMTPLPVPVVPNPVADYVLEASADTVAMPAEQPQLALVCNGWGKLKNVERALEAFALFRRQRPGAALHLYGTDFGVGEKAAQWAAQAGLQEGVVFHGRLPHRQLIAALAEHHVLLHTALEESFGVVVAEAMALGLPVVGGRHSGAVPWVLGANGQGFVDTGVLVDVASPADISRGLAEALDDAYPRRSAAARALVRRRFAPHAVANAYLALYAQVLRGGAAVRGLANLKESGS